MAWWDARLIANIHVTYLSLYVYLCPVPCLCANDLSLLDSRDESETLKLIITV